MAQAQSTFDILWRIFYFVLIWTACVIVFIALASPLNTHFNLSELIALDVPISLSTRIETTLTDFKNMLPTAGIIFGIALFVAIWVARFFIVFLPLNRHLIFAAVCATAVFVTLEILKVPFSGLVLIAGTRAILAYLGFGVAGAVAGILFAFLHPQFGVRK